MNLIKRMKDKTLAIVLGIVLIGGASLLASTLGLEGAGGIILVGLAFLGWRAVTE